jgi:hypothetical protein
LYRQRVDCLYKILHWPTVLAHITRSQVEVKDGYKQTPIAALELSIFFTSLCSITNEEAKNLGLGDRIALIEQYRGATEKALSEAGLLQLPNLTVLQAFVIYLVRSFSLVPSYNVLFKLTLKPKVGHRTFYNSAIWWTLLAVAVRAGTALRLGQEERREVKPMELQLRRRLWYCIALLDTHASYDRGTPPMIRWVDLGPAPLLLNDEEMAQPVMPISSTLNFNDMSFFALMSRGMVCQQQISSISDCSENGWTARLQVVSSFEISITQDYIITNKDATPLERFTKQVAKAIIASMHLVLRRPPYKQISGLVPSSDKFNVLEHSTKHLREILATKSTEFAPWAWKSLVPWNALAIVLVELCSHPSGEIYDAAYSIAIQSFNHYSNLIADTNTGMLWKPIKKLMRRVQQLKHSNRISEQPLSLISRLDVAPTNLADSGFLMTDLDLNLDSNVEDTYIPQSDQAWPPNGDAQINWALFTNSINMDYPVNWEHDLYFEL